VGKGNTTLNGPGWESLISHLKTDTSLKERTTLRGGESILLREEEAPIGGRSSVGSGTRRNLCQREERDLVLKGVTEG